jgi:hypothetical protein
MLDASEPDLDPAGDNPAYLMDTSQQRVHEPEDVATTCSMSSKYIAYHIRNASPFMRYPASAIILRATVPYGLQSKVLRDCNLGARMFDLNLMNAVDLVQFCLSIPFL